MAEGQLSSSSNAVVWQTQDAVTLDNAATDTSAIIHCDDYDHYSLIAWGADANVTAVIEISHDGTTFKTLYTSSAGNPVVSLGDLNARYLKVKITNSSGGDAQAVSAQLRLMRRFQ